jgi:hypothetical protein
MERRLPRQQPSEGVSPRKPSQRIWVLMLLRRASEQGFCVRPVAGRVSVGGSASSRPAGSACSRRRRSIRNGPPPGARPPPPSISFAARPAAPASSLVGRRHELDIRRVSSEIQAGAPIQGMTFACRESRQPASSLHPTRAAAARVDKYPREQRVDLVPLCHNNLTDSPGGSKGVTRMSFD